MLRIVANLSFIVKHHESLWIQTLNVSMQL